MSWSPKFWFQAVRRQNTWCNNRDLSVQQKIKGVQHKTSIFLPPKSWRCTQPSVISPQAVRQNCQCLQKWVLLFSLPPPHPPTPLSLCLVFALATPKLCFHVRRKRAVNICQMQPGQMTHQFFFLHVWNVLTTVFLSVTGEGKKQKTIDFLTQNSVSSLTAFHRRKRQAKETATWATQIPSRCCRRAW